MKLRNKVLVLFFILALFVCLALACSASEYDFLSCYDFGAVFDSNTIGGYFLHEVSCNNLSLTIFVFEGAGPGVPNSNSAYSVQPYAFKKFADSLTNSYGDCTYEKFYISCCELQEEYIANNDYSLDYFIIDWIRGHTGNTYLTEEYFNKLYFYNDELTYSEGYAEGITQGIIQAHEFTRDWLADNNLLSEPWGATGRLSSLEGLLEDNVLAAINNVRNSTINHAINALEGWLTSKGLTVKDYNRDFTVNDIDSLIAVNFDSAYSDWVKVGRSDAILRLSTWLSDNNIKYSSFGNNGLLSDIDNGLNLNVLPALDERQAAGYELGKTDGQSLGKTAMFNELVTYFNETYGTEYPTAVGSSFDFGVLQDAYTAAYEAGELYQINKYTDDGGISDFLADISGTVLSTFFYLGTNISFMGTTALSLISLFVIAAIVIFILKFFNKG